MSGDLFCLLSIAALVAGVVLIARDHHHTTNGNEQSWQELEQEKKLQEALNKLGFEVKRK